MIVASLPEGFRVAIVARKAQRPHLPMVSEWADSNVVWLGEGGWGRALRDTAALLPDLTLFHLDAQFDAASAARVPGIRIGMVTRPPVEQGGAWPLDSWCTTGALNGLTWFESFFPSALAKHVLSVLPLGVDRAGLKAPDFTRRGLVIPRWAMPSRPIVSHLNTFAELTVLEPTASTDEQLAALDASGIFLSAGHDAFGRLDPLPLLALARGLLVISVSPFPREWGIEEEDEYLVRREERLVHTVDEALRIPETARAVRMRAFLKAAEFFDAAALFKRLAFDAIAHFEIHRLLNAPTARVRAGGKA